MILESRASEKSLRINEANIFESLGSRTVPCPRGTSWSGGSTECAHTPWLTIFQGQTVRTVRAVCSCSYSSLKARLCGGGKWACPNLAALCDIYLASVPGSLRCVVIASLRQYIARSLRTQGAW